MSLFTHYTVSLSSSPLSTKSLTSMAVYIIGDIISQFSTGSNLHTVNRTRILKSGAAGGLGHGPLSHVWYGVSEKFFEMWGWNALSWGGEDHVLAVPDEAAACGSGRSLRVRSACSRTSVRARDGCL